MSKKQKQIPFKEYDKEVILKAIKLDEYGVGIARIDEYDIYLENVLEGEIVKAKILPPFANGSKRRPGIVLEYLQKSSDREDHEGELSNHSVYAYGSLKYEATLKRKADAIKSALKNAGIDYKDEIQIVPSNFDEPCRYKSIRYFGVENNRVIQGFFKARTHEVQEVKECQFEPTWFSEFANSLCELFTKLNIPVFNETTGYGLLRSLTLRDTKLGRLCALSVNSKPDNNVIDEYKRLALSFNIDAIFINCHENSNNKVIDGKVISLGSKDKIELLLSGFKFKADAQTFLQVNYDVATKLYQRAVDYCVSDKDNKNNDSYALDLCCGVGTMTLQLSKHFTHVTGVEIVEPSIVAAIENAKNNNVNNVSFICEDIKKCINSLTDKKVDALICDPSRVGIGSDACLSLCKLKKGVKLSYIFCSLKALSRDVKVLVENGYKLDKVIGFDMFPYTSHVETLVLLSKDK